MEKVEYGVHKYMYIYIYIPVRGGGRDKTKHDQI